MSILITGGDSVLARALRRALEVTALPAPYVVMSISADLPHGRYDHNKARTVLDWAPRAQFEHLRQDR